MKRRGLYGSPVVILGVVTAVFSLGALPPSAKGNGRDEGWGIAEEKEEKVDGDKVRNTYQKGRDYFSARDYSSARDKFEEVLGDNPDHAGAHRYLGRIYLVYYRDYNKAIRYLERAVSLSSGSYKRSPLYYLAQSYEKAGRWRPALAAWEDYLKLCDPGSRWEREAQRRIEDLKNRF